MAKVLDLSIQTLINQDIINLENFPDPIVSDFYKGHQDRRSKKMKTLNLSCIQAPELREELLYFIPHCFHLRNVSPSTAHIGYISHLKRVLETISKHNITSIRQLPENAFAEFHKISQFSSFEKALRNFAVSFHSNGSDFDLDVWDLTKFNLSSERIYKSNLRTTISFSKICGEENKLLCKKYIEHQLLGTNLSVSSITGSLSSLYILSEFFPNTPFTQIDRTAAVSFIEWLSSVRCPNTKTYNQRFFGILYFFEYLNLHGLMESNPFSHYDSKKQGAYQLKESSVDKYVINQIFKCLDKIPEVLALIFLLIYCTGMRVSEVCQIKLRCLEKREGNHFIIFYSQKMRKEVSNVIPENLYNWLSNYISRISSPDRIYLFESSIKGPYNSSTFRDKMQKGLKAFAIKNPDGSPFVFHPHDFRHTMGAKMRDMDIPFQYIQEQLHHESPEMTLAYTEFTNKKKIQKMNSYINIHGDQAPVTSDVVLTDDEAYAEWARAHINAQMLPNGVCSRPVKLGKCPHGNACLTCPEFRTSPEDLPCHKEHLSRVNQYLDEARKNNWVMQIEHSEEVKRNLVSIIDRLERMERGVTI